MTAHHSIFPLTVSEGHISITPEAKDEMFDVFMTQIDDQGNTMDFLGYNRLHLEPALHNLYTAILSIVHEHFRALNVNPDDLQFNVVKSWLNIKTAAKKNSIHDHGEAHYSFTYYPHIAPNQEMFIRFFPQHMRHQNEPVRGFLDEYVSDCNHANATSWSFLPKEGSVFVFPAHILHDTHNNNENTPEAMDQVLSKAELYNTRVCIGGDIVITSKKHSNNARILQPLNQWKTFPE